LSRVTDFDDVYVASRDRLLLQLYAYCGDADAAADALNEAFINASQHWHRVAALDSVDGWLRRRAVRRLDDRVRTGAAGRGGQPNRPNARMLAALAALDRTSRRLLIVRRLDDVPLPAAAREVGLTPGAAEQALARATTVLHGRGVDTTPAGFRSELVRLGDDLGGVQAVPARKLLRAGTRRRRAAAGLVAVVVVAVAATAGAAAVSRPGSSTPGVGHVTTTPPTTQPTSTPPTVPSPELGQSSLLTASQVTIVDAEPTARWHVLPPGAAPIDTSVYGDCVQAAVNPPPASSWVRDFLTGSPPGRTRLRQVLQLAPSDIEATRAYQQIVAGFGLCGGHQLLDYSRVGRLGERSQAIRLLRPGIGGSVVENVVVSQSGPAVTVLFASGPAGRPSALSPPEMVKLAGAAINRVCSETASGCAFPPYPIVSQRPPTDATAGTFLSVVDLPLVSGVTQPWVGTAASRVSDNPSATACDQTRFAGNGGTRVVARSYVIPHSPRALTLLGLTETQATFGSNGTARQFVADVARRVASCHIRQVTLRVSQSTALSVNGASGWVWQVRQQVSRQQMSTFRVALVRVGNTVAEVTFTPVGRYDVPPDAFAALAHRAALRLGA
jgi:DNA-directed RNA polymerase specialized sigma24 family protein